MLRKYDCGDRLGSCPEFYFRGGDEGLAEMTGFKSSSGRDFPMETGVYFEACALLAQDDAINIWSWWLMNFSLSAAGIIVNDYAMFVSFVAV